MTEIQTTWPADTDTAAAVSVARGTDEEGNVIYNTEYIGDPDWENSAILPTNPIYNSAWWFVETNED